MAEELKNLKAILEKAISENVPDDIEDQALAELKRSAKSYEDLKRVEKDIRNKYKLSDRQFARVRQKWEYDGENLLSAGE